jgi:cytochrome c oxidase subunit II
MRGRDVIRWLFVAMGLAACEGPQNYMKDTGPAASGLASLGWFVLIVFGAATICVLLLIAWFAVRRRGTLDWHAPIDSTEGQRWIVVGGVFVPVIVLAVIFVGALHSMRAYPMAHHEGVTPEIRVTGRQWWFNAEYLDAGTQGRVSVPTELHIVTGRPIDIELVTRDVIHSFWVPKLHGKVDLVPGMQNMIRIEADRPGEYAGECGEYCGVQHANMRLQIVAQTQEQYAAWLRNQRAEAREPTTPEQSRGRDVFMAAACPLCHAVRGTPALGDVGPDLTHVGSRKRIAGGMLVNNRANLQAWITHAQSLKPGSQMPDLATFDGEQLNALAAYLQSLQ